MIFPDQTVIFQHSLSFWMQQTTFTCKRIYIIQQPQSYCKPLEQIESNILRIECITPRLTLILKYVKIEQNVPVGIYMFKLNNRNTRTKDEICSKLTIKTPERRHWRYWWLFQSKSLVLLKLKELTNYVNFVSDDATPNTLTIGIIKKATKNL